MASCAAGRFGRAWRETLALGPGQPAFHVESFAFDATREGGYPAAWAGGTRTMTIELPPGSTPAPNISSVRWPGTGNDAASAVSAPRTNDRTARVSGSSKMTPATLPSRALRLIRRSMAWTSRGPVSASTPYRHVDVQIIASQDRRSFATGNGTSDAHRTVRWRRERNSASRRRCATSRMGPLPGNARADNSSPTTSRRRAKDAIETAGTSPRSIRLTDVAERPTAVPTRARDRPRSTRASCSS